MLARAIQGSNTIEGYTVDLTDAMELAEGEGAIDPADETRMAIAGYRDAMTYVLQLSKDPHFTYSDGLIRSLHFMMLRYDMSRSPGLWRPGPVFVHQEPTGQTVYGGPDAELVPALAAELVADLQTTNGSPALVRAAMAHLNFVMIHPFRDGNGRMARILQSLVLAREGLLAPEFASIEEYLGRNTQAYYDVLAETGGGSWHPERAALAWVRFCLTAHLRQARTLSQRVEQSERLWSLLEAEATRLGLPDRCGHRAVRRRPWLPSPQQPVPGARRRVRLRRRPRPQAAGRGGAARAARREARPVLRRPSSPARSHGSSPAPDERLQQRRSVRRRATGAAPLSCPRSATLRTWLPPPLDA